MTQVLNLFLHYLDLHCLKRMSVFLSHFETDALGLTEVFPCKKVESRSMKVNNPVCWKGVALLVPWLPERAGQISSKSSTFLLCVSFDVFWILLKYFWATFWGVHFVMISFCCLFFDWFQGATEQLLANFVLMLAVCPALARELWVNKSVWSLVKCVWSLWRVFSVGCLFMFLKATFSYMNSISWVIASCNKVSLTVISMPPHIEYLIITHMLQACNTCVLNCIWTLVHCPQMGLFALLSY